MTGPIPVAWPPGRASELMKWRRANYPSLTETEAQQLSHIANAMAEREIATLERLRKRRTSP